MFSIIYRVFANPLVRLFDFFRCPAAGAYLGSFFGSAIHRIIEVHEV